NLVSPHFGGNVLMKRNTLFCVAGIVVVAASVQAQGTFTRLGTSPTYVTGMSADGTIVVGVSGAFGPAFRWTASTGVVNIGSVSQQAKISRDGMTIVGDAKRHYDRGDVGGRNYLEKPWRNPRRAYTGRRLKQQLGSIGGRVSDRWPGLGESQRWS